MSEGIYDSAQSPAVWLVCYGHDHGRSGIYRAREHRIRIIADEHLRTVVPFSVSGL